jgi:hypothetical protein
MSTPEFYVATPLGDRTAGPEALTQLVDAIRRRGLPAYLIPMRNFRGRRNDPEYDIYDFEVRQEIPKGADARLVISEVSPIESRRELRRVPVEHTWMGWFSVNNCPDPRARYYRPSEMCGPTYPPGFVAEVPPVPADLGLGKLVRKNGGFIGAALAKRTGLTDTQRASLVGLVPVDGVSTIRSGSQLVATELDARASGVVAKQGFVSSSTPSEFLGHPIALAFLDNGAKRMGQEIIAASPLSNEFVRVRVVSPVFVDPENQRLKGAQT